MTEEQEMRIITHGIQMMKVMSEIHGAEKGMEMWNTIGESLGAEIKGKIFFAMLSGTSGGSTITVKAVDKAAVQKIGLIKAIRTVDIRGLGLMESKLLSEDLIDRDKSITLQINPESYFASQRELVNVGCIIS